MLSKKEKESTPVTAPKSTTTSVGAELAAQIAEGEVAPAVEEKVQTEEGVGVEPVEIPTVEPDWAETLRNEGPSVMMQKLCGFKLSHAEKTPDDPAERCARTTFAFCPADLCNVNPNSMYQNRDGGEGAN